MAENTASKQQLAGWKNPKIKTEAQEHDPNQTAAEKEKPKEFTRIEETYPISFRPNFSKKQKRAAKRNFEKMQARDSSYKGKRFKWAGHHSSSPANFAAPLMHQQIPLTRQDNLPHTSQFQPQMLYQAGTSFGDHQSTTNPPATTSLMNLVLFSNGMWTVDSQPQDLESLKKKNQELEDELEEIKKSQYCPICKSAKRNTVILDSENSCGHAFCEGCSNMFQNCPFCGKKVKSLMKIYL